MKKLVSEKPSDPIAEFQRERAEAVASYKDDAAWNGVSGRWLDRAFRQKYMYNFAWLGRPIIQLPADMVAFQEIVWNTKPDLIIETGVAHGGSLILSASMLALLDYCDAAERGAVLDPKKPNRKVLGIDIDIRPHNRAAIEAHPLATRIEMIQGSSVAPETIGKVANIARNYPRVMVCLDSNHVHDHVLAELELYAPLVTKGCYCIVFDTIVEDLSDDVFPDRPWSHGNNPKTAVHAYLKKLEKEKADVQFEIDREFESKLLLNATPDGFLRRL
ncbi:MAG TPA: cephalosporin hydroxylase family protein [Alphaproteobacteria bacterium]|nr:cephalosporin hydroxylase family protein [Alphaproteobacteria bacterium]